MDEQPRFPVVQRNALTVIEVLIVIFIIAVLLGLLFPAVQATREKGREAVCKNNLYQLNIAVAHFTEAHKKLPLPNPQDRIGGWTVEILPQLEEGNLLEKIPLGTAITAAPDFMLQAPVILRCPARDSMDETPADKMQPSHYILAPLGRRDTYALYDAPVAVSIPWASGAEVDYSSIKRQLGPHHGGFFYARGFQKGVDFESSKVGGD